MVVAGILNRTLAQCHELFCVTSTDTSSIPQKMEIKGGSDNHNTLSAPVDEILSEKQIACIQSITVLGDIMASIFCQTSPDRQLVATSNFGNTSCSTDYLENSSTTEYTNNIFTLFSDLSEDDKVLISTLLNLAEVELRLTLVLKYFDDLKCPDIDIGSGTSTSRAISLFMAPSDCCVDRAQTSTVAHQLHLSCVRIKDQLNKQSANTIYFFLVFIINSM